MTVNIYQINQARDEEHLAFQGWREFERHGYDRPSATLYDRVYSYQTEKESPEDIYFRFNMARPADFTGRSLSMSDIVEFIWDVGEHECFFCDTIGFQSVEFDSFLVGTEDDFPRRLELLKENQRACGIVMEEIARRAIDDDQNPERAGRRLVQAYYDKDPEAILDALTGWDLKALIKLAFHEED